MFYWILSSEETWGLLLIPSIQRQVSEKGRDVFDLALRFHRDVFNEAARNTPRSLKMLPARFLVNSKTVMLQL